MPLTVAWWKGVKKTHGKGAPSTGFEALLVTYEAALKKLGIAKTLENAKAVETALNEVVTGRKAAIEALEKDEKKPGRADKWKDLIGDLNSLSGKSIKDARESIDGILEDLLLARKVEQAGSQAEAKYEQLYAIFEKQELALAQKGDRAGYKTVQSTLDKLLELAEECKAELTLIKKYNTQTKVLTAKKLKFTQEAQTYETKIAQCVSLRQTAIGEVQEVETLLTRNKSQLLAIQKKAQEAKTADDDVALQLQRKAAGMILKGALEKMQEIADKYLASGTVIKDATDVKAVKMSLTELTDVIKPLSDEMFKLNRANNALMKEIKELAQAIAT